MKNIMEHSAISTIRKASSTLCALIAFIQFYDPSINLKSMNFPFVIILIKSAAVGIGIYVLFLSMQAIIKKLIVEATNKLQEKINELESEKNNLEKKIFFRDIVRLESINQIYPPVPFNNITTNSQIEQEKLRVRNNFVVNKKIYNFSLDFIENEIDNYYAFLNPQNELNRNQ
jgi:hypothetical protein